MVKEKKIIIIKEKIATPKKKKTTKRKRRKTTTPKKNIHVEKALIENFVSLQKVMTNMAIKFDSLSEQISKLLELFEISAKTLAEKGYSMEDRKVAEKLDNLLDQNKIIAKGIALLHEREIEQIQEIPKYPITTMQPRITETRKEPPRFPLTPAQEILKVKEMGA
ncbi:hypothetical protein M0R72_03510 [Candidatus Pacearchaeota archaeon]|jgi:hypothetical protein|nr:hypothetical protein [Candidatus Pacearchaeota archaeon]